MERYDDDPRLNQISTRWSLVFLARDGPPDESIAALAVLMDRYAGAAHRYLLNALRDEEEAAELAQEFALRFLRGDFLNSHPSRGRFRDYVGRSLHNLVMDHYRRRSARPQAPADLGEVAAPAEGPEDFYGSFREDWRRELLSKAWRKLGECSRRRGQPLDRVLQCRVANPDARSAGLAALLSAELGRPVGAEWVRKNLQRARELFAACLLEEVTASLDRPTRDDLEEELSELRLLEYCRPALSRRVP